MSVSATTDMGRGVEQRPNALVGGQVVATHRLARHPPHPLPRRDARDSQTPDMTPSKSRARRQASAISKAVTLRVSRLNSTPTRCTGDPEARYLSA